jgi:DNA-directed RNA polymerase specialized sigma24 family protein
VSLTTDQASVTHAREKLIIAALRSGNLRRAVEMLFETYQDDLYAYCVRRVGTSEALGVYHRVLESAISDLSLRDATASLRAWLFGVARKTIAEQKRGRRPTLQCDVSASELEHAMAALPSRTREVLQLTIWHGLTLSEVATITGLPLAEVRELAGDGIGTVAMRFAQPGGKPA